MRRDRLTELRHETNADQVFASFQYTYDASGNRTSVTEHDGRRVEYAYDELDRLIEERTFQTGGDAATRNVEYAYDPVGNRLTRDDSDEGVTTYLYDQNDRLLEEAIDGVVTRYRYDDNGNTLAKSVDNIDQALYEWNIDGRLVRVDTNADGVDDLANEYDVDGIRISQTVDPDGNIDKTVFLMDGNREYQQVLEEFKTDGTIMTSYVHGWDLISQDRHSDTGKSFHHVDGLGSTVVLTDIAGAVTDSYRYDAYGRTTERIGTTTNVYQFAGEARDASGLDYLRARYLNPNNGRFFGMDPAQGFISDPMTLNRFLYANANPINYVDPSGEFLVSISISLSISATLSNVQVSFAKAGVKAVVRTAVVGELLLRPALAIRSEGMLMVADGIPGGFAFYEFGSRWTANSFRLIGGFIADIYSDTFNDLYTFEAEVEIEFGGFELEFGYGADGWEFELETPWFEIELPLEIDTPLDAILEYIDEDEKIREALAKFYTELVTLLIRFT